MVDPSICNLVPRTDPKDGYRKIVKFGRPFYFLAARNGTKFS